MSDQEVVKLTRILEKLTNCLVTFLSEREYSKIMSEISELRFSAQSRQHVEYGGD